MKTVCLLGVATMALALAACGEKQQTASAKKPDAPAWQGTDTAYAANGWKAGDQAAWEQQMQKRLQGQNEYVRIGGQ
jgi:hypothetical protein